MKFSNFDELASGKIISGLGTSRLTMRNSEVIAEPNMMLRTMR